ncbi:NADH:flavin oxidoreductase [Planoprotostelium fungivorum]|uniref:NADH:flavin oxidoreductase n=1 Tax=Planoprotostelium fungivorum TaxID=1890364 RepID=A0A2P6N6E0_9EUKA|nr:NADH:flavin oxidoreductase [Planoprotostelium fungivorum]
MPSLSDPIRAGALSAPNRIWMAPLTRGRATREHVPEPIMAQYYAQRAGAGVIISEATGVSQQGLGWPYAPGLWTDEQTEAWKPATEAVHKAGGLIVAQLWHMGRIVHPSFNNGAAPVSSSNIPAPGQTHTYDGKQDYTVPRSLPLEEIPALIEDYRIAARNAIRAGFDGVQIHAANGYLIDQFLRDSDNHRTDIYGGSIENRIRLLLEVTKAVTEIVGADRTGVRLSPNGLIQGTNDSNPQALFTAAAKGLDELGIAFLELREPDFNGTFGKADVAPIAPHIRKVFRGVLVLNADYDGEKGQKELDGGVADVIAFGRTFLANPDLVHKIQNKLPLNKDDALTWYSRGPKGYIDYPTADAATAEI